MEALQVQDEETTALVKSEGVNNAVPTLAGLCDAIRESFPKLQKLRLCLHPQKADEPSRLPGKEWFQPLYKLAKDMDLRTFVVKIVVNCEPTSAISYGETPAFLRNAPFKAVLVPEGWHADNTCTQFTVV